MNPHDVKIGEIYCVTSGSHTLYANAPSKLGMKFIDYVDKREEFIIVNIVDELAHENLNTVYVQVLGVSREFLGWLHAGSYSNICWTRNSVKNWVLMHSG